MLLKFGHLPPLARTHNMIQKTQKITKLYCFIVKKDGFEGVFGMTQADGSNLPIVSLDVEDINKVRPIVEAFSKEKNLKYEIRTFQRSLI